MLPKSLFDLTSFFFFFLSWGSKFYSFFITVYILAGIVGESSKQTAIMFAWSVQKEFGEMIPSTILGVVISGSTDKLVHLALPPKNNIAGYFPLLLTTPSLLNYFLMQQNSAVAKFLSPETQFYSLIQQIFMGNGPHFPPPCSTSGWLWQLMNGALTNAITDV